MPEPYVTKRIIVDTSHLKEFKGQAFQTMWSQLTKLGQGETDDVFVKLNVKEGATQEYFTSLGGFINKVKESCIAAFNDAKGLFDKLLKKENSSACFDQHGKFKLEGLEQEIRYLQAMKEKYQGLGERYDELGNTSDDWSGAVLNYLTEGADLGKFENYEKNISGLTNLLKFKRSEEAVDFLQRMCDFWENLNFKFEEYPPLRQIEDFFGPEIFQVSTIYPDYTV